MISICIPIYNFKVAKLVTSLTKQAKKATIAVEIILIDDCSDDSFKKENASICAQHKYIELEKNIGRAAIRNLFLQYATYEYLLFLDCDSYIISNDFIKKYIASITSPEFSIVCGGRVYPQKLPSKNQILRWKYGIKKESKSVTERSRYPNKSFMTNNFLIQKELFEQIKFDERLQQYGHEDTLFGHKLKKQKISITHIDNPVLNGDLETNHLFIEKTEQSIENLVKIVDYRNNDQSLINDITLLKQYFKLRKLIWLVNLIFFLIKPLIKRNLNSKNPSLILFDFYKLGTLSKMMKQR